MTLNRELSIGYIVFLSTFNIPTHQKIANKNHIMILSHTSLPSTKCKQLIRKIDMDLSKWKPFHFH